MSFLKDFLGARDARVAKRSANPNGLVGSINVRQYYAAKQSRLTGGFNPSTTSADTELATSLRALRDRARSLVRDASYGKRARTIVVNNVVGSGIGMQAAVTTNDGKLNTRINDAIESAWEEWCLAENCHTGGRLHFKMFERQLMGQVFDAGDVFTRLHPFASGGSRVPLSLELIESERVPDDSAVPYLASIDPGNEVRMGVEVDWRFQRPIAYFIRTMHPSEYRFVARAGGNSSDLVDRIPAADVIQLGLIDRWPQTRGEPWMHAVARRINDMDAYSEAEIIRSRTQALTAGAIETPESLDSWAEKQPDGSYEMELQAGVIPRLLPGEHLSMTPNNAPNPGLDGFMRYMLREIAAGIGVSYESLSRDYSQSNYSSSRLALMDDRDLWRYFQTWFITDFRERLHRIWLTRAVLAGAIPALPREVFFSDPQKYLRVKFKPRGWTWIDPASEVEAYKEAVKAGFTTVTDVVAATAGGQDIEDVMNTRESELADMDDRGLVFDTSPEVYKADNQPPPRTNEPVSPTAPAQGTTKSARALRIAERNTRWTNQ